MMCGRPPGMRRAGSCLLAALLVGLPLAARAQAVPPKDAQGEYILFSDEFRDPGQSRANWVVNENGGSVGFHLGALSLKDDPPGFNGAQENAGRQYDHSGFPLVRLARDPFPATGDWTLQFRLSFNKFGPPNPTGVTVLRGDGTSVLSVMQDNTGQYAILNGYIVWRTDASDKAHHVALARHGDRVVLSVDDTPVGDAPAGAAPATVRLGGRLEHDSRKWNNFDLLSLVVTAPALPPVSATGTAGGPVPDMSLVRRQFALKDATIARLRRQLAARNAPPPRGK